MGTIRQPENLSAYNNDGTDHPHEIIIDNWRYIREDYFQGERTIGRGCYVLGCQLYFVPGIVAEQLIDLADNGGILDVFFFPLQHGGPWCHRCLGAGKLTWVENARGGLTRHLAVIDHRQKEYNRNSSCVMVYSRSSFYSQGKHLFLAPTIFSEGEILCKDCKGTGLWLNATVHIFQGFPRIKSRIVYEVGDKYDTETMYKMLSQDCLQSTV